MDWVRHNPHLVGATKKPKRGEKTDGEVSGSCLFDTLGVSTPTKHGDQRNMDGEPLRTPL